MRWKDAHYSGKKRNADAMNRIGEIFQNWYRIIKDTETCV
jgi:hypothetical protein